MASKHFQNPARREWWSVHVEAWRRSGLSQRLYCRRHRLTDTTFSRWLKVLMGDKALRAKAEMAREKRLERDRRNGKPLSNDTRSRAVQAFWAMHVEALTWSGMSANQYATALRISPQSLRRWRDLFDTGEAPVDWRAHLHPSARPQISPRTKGSAKESGVETGLTDVLIGEPVDGGRSPRRKFTDDEKLAIVLECERSGATVSSVARAHNLATSPLFRWRAELGYGRKERVKFAEVRLPTGRADGGSYARETAIVMRNLLPTPDGMAAVDLPDGRRVFAPMGADPEAVRRHVAQREMAR